MALRDSEGRAILLIQPQRPWLGSLEFGPSWYASIIPKSLDFLLEAILYRFYRFLVFVVA